MNCQGVIDKLEIDIDDLLTDFDRFNLFHEYASENRS